ncbi:hypothetical protein AB0A77_02125 [Streptomyces varsoviensis]|uniref:hypothetical protein n=1 Tax=Streptomyces varsoviensis TaxID=67373 RepID=UPI0033D578EB
MADVEQTLTTWLRATFAVHASVDLPPELEKRLPWVQVVRVGGPDARFSRHPRVDLDVYAESPDASADLLSRIHDRLLFLSGTVTGAVIRRVTSVSGPSQRPYVNPDVYRRGAAYTVSLRAE